MVSDTEKDYSDLTPNDILKEVKNKDRVEAWGLNKTFQNSMKEEKNNIDNGPKFSEFKNTIKGLDEETRTKFVQEIAKATTPEEITKGLNSFTAFMLQRDKSNTSQENEQKENKEESAEFKLDEEVQTEQRKEIKLDEEMKEESSKEVKLDEEANTNQSKEEKTNEKINPEPKKESKSNEEIQTEQRKEIKLDEKMKAESSKEVKLDEEIKTESNEEVKSNKDIKIEQVEEEKTSEDKKIEPIDEVKANEEEKIVNDVEEDKAKQLEEQEEISFEEMYKKLFGRNIEEAQKQYKEKIAEEEDKYPISPIKDNEISMFESDDSENKMPYQFIGIAFNTYIILSINNDLYILDQHAAHERIMYEKVKKNYYEDKEKDSQLMLLPDIINLNNKEMGIFRDNKMLFEKAGFMVEEFGDNTIKLTGVPEFCMDYDTKEIFLETLDEINTVARTAKQELEDKFLATVACKAAVKAHMALTKEEVDNLMQELLKLPNPFSCPHGRPTVIKMSKNDIEKKFSRR